MAYAQAVHGQHSQRSVTPALAIGIFFLPFIFAWFVLGRGYSARARLLAFGWLFGPAALALVLSGNVPKGATSVATMATQSSSTEGGESVASDQGAKEEAAVRLDAANRAEDALKAARPAEGEDAQQFNERVTKLYNRWVLAEKAAEGPDWQKAYLSRHALERMDCSQLYGRVMHEDAQLRQMRAVCAAEAYLPNPTIPTLESFLLKAEDGSAPSGDGGSLTGNADEQAKNAAYQTEQ